MNHKSSVFNFLNLDPFPLGSQTSSVIQGFFLNLSMVLGRLEALAIYCFTLASPMSSSRMYGISPGSHGTSHVSCSSFLTRDRKSTRLNSSHLGISYAVFCLKK